MDMMTGRRDRTLRILQLNANCSSRAMDVAYARAKATEADFICLSEPNKRQCAGKRHVYPNGRRTAAVVRIGTTQRVLRYGEGGCYALVETEEMCLISVYISPNVSEEDTNRDLDDLTDALKAARCPAVVAGDFNAKNVTWGGTTTDERGRAVANWAAQNGLTVLNDGRHATCVRHNGQSFVDLTFVSDRLTGTTGWRVEADEVTLSDHRLIVTDIVGRGGKASNPTTTTVDLTRYRTEVKRRLAGRGLLAPEECVAATKAAARRAARRLANPSSAYWWSEELGVLRTRAQAARRAYLRDRARGTDTTDSRTRCDEATRQYRREIGRAKAGKWRGLCDDLERDPYGQAFRIVMGNLKTPYPRMDLSLESRIRLFKELFVWEGRDDDDILTSRDEPVEQLTEDELRRAAGGIKPGKAPGPDGIEPRLVKIAVEEAPAALLGMYEQLWRRGVFPKPWKVARLVLAEKSRADPAGEPKYRPICLLDVYGKLYERLIGARLSADVEASGGLHDRQYGFRRG
ncbi:hypothetical protein PPYR_15080, partial [Photinus pyralis]